MLVTGSAVLVAGGRDMMVFNMTLPEAPTLAATCGEACARVMLSSGQNAHGLDVQRNHGQALVLLTAQIDNRLGAVEVLDPALEALLFD
jgi:hypothetical protein